MIQIVDVKDIHNIILDLVIKHDKVEKDVVMVNNEKDVQIVDHVQVDIMYQLIKILDLVYHHINSLGQGSQHFGNHQRTRSKNKTKSAK